ncbi:MAG TPA: ABC transporter substrate-binding protein [Chloroflexota bacterium]|nr:ABC transporter substrate-binding protein [Chloroflexota bacterium]
MAPRLSSLLPALLLLVACAAPARAPAQQPAAPASGPAGQAPRAEAPARPPALQEATLRLDWVPGPHHAGPALALERGYYQAEGIDLRIGEGTGSGVTVQAVAGGQDTFGFADAGTMAVAVARGAPVKMVANTTQRSPIGVIYLPPTVVERPQDLAGKTIGAASGDASLTALPAVARKNGVDPESYRIVTIEAATKVPALLERRVDTLVGFRFGDYLRAWTVNPNVKIQLYADWGVNTLGNGYLTHVQTIQDKPELVRGFVRATLRGWKDVQADQAAGIAALLKQFPATKEEFLVAGLPWVLEHFYSDETRGRPLGWMSERDWQQTVDILREYGGMESSPPLSALYTNDFIPAD